MRPEAREILLDGLAEEAEKILASTGNRPAQAVKIAQWCMKKIEMDRNDRIPLDEEPDLKAINKTEDGVEIQMSVPEHLRRLFTVALIEMLDSVKASNYITWRCGYPEEQFEVSIQRLDDGSKRPSDFVTEYRKALHQIYDATRTMKKADMIRFIQDHIAQLKLPEGNGE